MNLHNIPIMLYLTSLYT